MLWIEVRENSIASFEPTAPAILLGPFRLYGNPLR
jgi:hypothetical protein